MIYMAIGKHYSLIMVFILLASFVLMWVPQVSAAVPTTTLTVSGPEYNDSQTYVNDLTVFSLSTTPSIDSSIWYRWDSNPYAQYAAPFTAVLINPNPGGAPSFPIELVGLHTLYYNASSDAGEHETPRSLEIFVDSTFPVTSLTFSGEHHEDTVNYITSNTNITLSALDSGSGIDKIYYAIGDAQDIEYTGQFTISGSGSRTLNYYAIDNLGNKESDKSIELFLDNTGPALDVSMGSPTYVLEGITYATEHTGFTITTSDNSGISLVRYNIDDWSWNNYDGPFYLTQGGSRILNIEAVDNLGHTSTESLVLYMDNSPPEITTSLSNTNNRVVDYGTLFYLYAIDDDIPGSDCSIYFSLDDGITWHEYVIPIVLQETGNITFYAENVLGNSSPSETMEITVNPQSDLMKYVGISLIIAGVGIVILLFINRDRFMSKKKDSEPTKKSKKDNKKKSKKQK